MTAPRHPDPAQAFGEVLAEATAELAAINARSQTWAAQLTAAHQRRKEQEQ